jgi:hypothetical protein
VAALFLFGLTVLAAEPVELQAAAGVSLDQLTSQAEAVFLGKSLGEGRVRVSEVIKGNVPQEIVLSVLRPDEVPAGKIYLFFIQDAATWTPLNKGVFKAVRDEDGNQMVTGKLDPVELVTRIGADIRRGLANMPAPAEFQKRTVMRRSLDDVVEAVAARQPEQPGVTMPEFLTVLNAVVKIQSLLSEGKQMPDRFLGPTGQMPGDLVAPPGINPAKSRPERLKEAQPLQTCPAGATDLMLGDEDFANVNFTNFSFPYGGVDWNGLFIFDNGYVTFSWPWMPYWLWIPSPWLFFNPAPPVIAPFWADLAPNFGGTISYWENPDGSEFVVCWDDVPGWNDTYLDNNTVILHLYDDGSFVFEYGWISDISYSMIGWNSGGWPIDERSVSGDWDFTQYDGMVLGDGTQRRWYDLLQNDYGFMDFVTLAFPGNPDQTMPSDPYEMNNLPSAATPVLVDHFATLDGGKNMVPGDTDWYRFTVPYGVYMIVQAYTQSYDLIKGSPPNDNWFDTMLGLFDANGDLIDMNDDMSAATLDSALLAYLGPGDYYLAVTGYGDSGFRGAHTEDGSYGLNIDLLDWTDNPLPLGDETYLAVTLPFDFPFDIPWRTLYITENGFSTFMAPVTDWSESVADLENGPPRLAAWWDDLDTYWSSYPYGIYYYASEDYAYVWYYGVWDWVGYEVVNVATVIYPDGTIDNFYDVTTGDGITGYGLGVGYPSGGSMDLFGEFINNSVYDYNFDYWTIGTGWELYMFQQFNPGDPILLPGDIFFFGCYPYEYMTYDLDTNTYIYLNVPNMFRVMDRGIGYVSETIDPIVGYHGDQVLFLFPNAINRNWDIHGYFWYGYPYYGYASGSYYGMPFMCMGY